MPALPNAGTTNVMARTGRAPPRVSKLELIRQIAFARRTRGDGDDAETESEPEPARPRDPETTAPIAAALADMRAAAEKPAPDAAVAADPALSVAPAEAPSAVEAPAALAAAGEAVTQLPGPRDIPPGEPTDPAPAPGAVPRGDSRSLRRGGEFALVYRVQTAVISRTGSVGTRGVWRVVDYPTSSMASNAYAKEVSRYIADGFSDYRD